MTTDTQHDIEYELTRLDAGTTECREVYEAISAVENTDPTNLGALAEAAEEARSTVERIVDMLQGELDILEGLLDAIDTAQEETF